MRFDEDVKDEAPAEEGTKDVAEDESSDDEE